MGPERSGGTTYPGGDAECSRSDCTSMSPTYRGRDCHRWSARTSKRSWPNDSIARRGSPPSMRMWRASRPFAAFASWPAALPLRSTNATVTWARARLATDVAGGAMLVGEQVDHDAAGEEIVKDVAQGRSPPPGQHAEWREGRTHLEPVVGHGIVEGGGAEETGEHDDRGGGSAAGADRERRQSEMVPDHARVPATGRERGRADERGIGRPRPLEVTSTDSEQSRRSPLGRRQRLDDRGPRRTERTRRTGRRRWTKRGRLPPSALPSDGGSSNANGTDRGTPSILPDGPYSRRNARRDRAGGGTVGGAARGVGRTRTHPGPGTGVAVGPRPGPLCRRRLTASRVALVGRRPGGAAPPRRDGSRRRLRRRAGVAVTGAAGRADRRRRLEPRHAVVVHRRGTAGRCDEHDDRGALAGRVCRVVPGGGRRGVPPRRLQRARHRAVPERADAAMPGWPS